MFQRIVDTALSTSKGNLFSDIVKKMQFHMSINQEKEENMKKDGKLEKSGQGTNGKEVENRKSENSESESKEMGGEEETSSERIITSMCRKKYQLTQNRYHFFDKIGMASDYFWRSTS